MEALITVPYAISAARLHEVNSFGVRLGRRGYTFRIEYADTLGVSLDGVPHDYETLFSQSLGWTPLSQVSFQRLTETAILPSRGSLDCAGLDLYADIREPIVLTPGKVVMIPTGIAVQCPQGAYAKIEERSSLGAKGVSVRGGIVDRDYRGEIKVMLQLLSCDKSSTLSINFGDRVAQLIFSRYMDCDATLTDMLPRTVRDNGGWGSTGR